MPLTEEQIIAGHYRDARKLSDDELKRHYRGSCICGECFTCIAGKVLKLRKLKRQVAEMEAEFRKAEADYDSIE